MRSPLQNRVTPAGEIIATPHRGLFTGKVVQAGVIDVASVTVETAEDVAKVIDDVSKFVPKTNIVATTNCGMAPMHRDIAEAKLMALGAGAKLARQQLG